MCVYSYTNLTNSYNIFTIIDSLHCSLALFFFNNTLVLLVLLKIICAYIITLTQQIFTIFLSLLRSQFFKGQNKIIT